MNIKTILSIDFDIIMAPTIPSYNDRVPRVSWEQLLKEPFYKMCYADYEIYQNLTNYLLSLCSKVNKNNIHFIYDHHQIVPHLDANNYYHVINIDFHHDMGYEDLKPGDKEELGCANWVKFVPHLLSYDWIHARNADIPPEDKWIKNSKHFNIHDLDLIKDLNQDIEEIYICLSPPWLPPSHRPLFYLWMDLFNKHYNTHFSVEENIYDRTRN